MLVSLKKAFNFVTKFGIMDNTILQKYNYLPLELRKEVADFIEFLVQKYQQKQAIVTPPTRPSNFGSAKGLITMSDDFNEPLEEFQDYM
jgi:hypothetical protein